MCHTLQWKRWVIEMNGPSIEELCCIALQILFLADAAVQSLHGWCVAFIELDGDQILATRYTWNYQQNMNNPVDNVLNADCLL